MKNEMRDEMIVSLKQIWTRGIPGSKTFSLNAFKLQILFLTLSFSSLLHKAFWTLSKLAATCGSGCFDKTSRRFIYSFSVSFIFFSLLIMSEDIFKMRFCRICTFLMSSKVVGSVPCYGEKAQLFAVKSLNVWKVKIAYLELKSA
jgi:hypothetical protein